MDTEDIFLEIDRRLYDLSIETAKAEAGMNLERLLSMNNRYVNKFVWAAEKLKIDKFDFLMTFINNYNRTHLSKLGLDIEKDVELCEKIINLTMEDNEIKARVNELESSLIPVGIREIKKKMKDHWKIVFEYDLPKDFEANITIGGSLILRTSIGVYDKYSFDYFHQLNPVSNPQRQPTPLSINLPRLLGMGFSSSWLFLGLDDVDRSMSLVVNLCKEFIDCAESRFGDICADIDQISS